MEAERIPWRNRITGHGDADPAQLVANPANWRAHPKHQQRALESVLGEVGWVQDVIVNQRTGRLVDGHLRVALALKRKEPFVPAVYVDLDETEERLVLASLDPIGAMAEADAKKLGALLREVQIPDADLADRLADLLRQAEAAAGGEELPGVGTDGEGEVLELFSEDQIAEQVQADFPAFESAEEVAGGLITPGMAMGQFNKLASGRESGYYISALFNPHRFATAGASGRDFVSHSGKATFRENAARYLARYYQGDVHPHSVVKYAAAGWASVTIPNEFRPALARDIYRRFCPAGGRVLDPCHGWGGRVIGWLAADLGGHYVGFDPATRTNTGVRNLIEFLSGSKTTSTAEVHCMCFEEADLEPESFDFAFTSPPYFDTEKYSAEETNSLNRYPEFDAWVESFYRPLILSAMAALKPGGAFLLNVGNNRYPLGDKAREIAAGEGHQVSALQDYRIGRGGGALGLTPTEEGQYDEDFLLIRKG